MRVVIPGIGGGTGLADVRAARHGRSTRAWGGLLLLWALLHVHGCAPGDETPLRAVRGALLGKDGPQTITGNGQVVNTYGALAGNAARGATSITVASAATLGFLQPGDLLMIIQMQGVNIDTIDSALYGSVSTLDTDGQYELIGVTAVAGNTISLDGSCGGLRNNYSAAGRTQVIRVPQYTTLTIPNNTSISAGAWDGAMGGVAAIFVLGSVTFSGSAKIDVTGKGFRGGGLDASSQTGTTPVTLFRSLNTVDGAEKGEGIAGFQSSVPDGFYGRGAPATGGGGGNYARAGGGGGGNGDSGQVWTGHGVMDMNVTGGMAWMVDPAYIANNNMPTNSSGGGRGGYSSAAVDRNALTVGPGDSSWGGDSRREAGGRGGRPVRNDAGSLLFLGGGGGAGEGATAGTLRGGSGGGMVLLFARDITGSGRIVADGAAGAASAMNEGAGGGGGGGTIVVSAARTLSGLSLQANGGAGGNNVASGAASQGPGGGGGGGYIAAAGGQVPRSAVGGLAGTSNGASVSEFPNNGATAGANGQPDIDANLAIGSYYPSCIATDMVVTATAGQSFVVPGSSAKFTVSVKNVGPLSMNDVRFVEKQPLVLTSVTWSCTSSGGASCSTSSGSGALPALVDMPNGGQLDFVMTGQVPVGMTAGPLTYSLSAVVPNGYSDPTPGNSTGSATSNVIAGSLIDLGLRVRTDPVEPAVGESLTYIFSVNNRGPGTTSSATVSFVLPTGAALQAVQFGDGWNCNTMNQSVTCLRSAPLSRDQTTELRLTVSPPAGAASIRIVATVASNDSGESSPADNSVTWDVPIGVAVIYAAGGGWGCALIPRSAAATGGAAGFLGVATSVGLALGVRRRRAQRRGH